MHARGHPRKRRVARTTDSFTGVTPAHKRASFGQEKNVGFFDKAKNFFGGHGLKVEITRLERQDPTTVTFPIGDTVFKGNYRVLAEKDCTVLSHTHELVARRKHPDGREEHVVLGSDRHDETTEIIGGKVKWPYELRGGTSVDDSFLIMDIDIPAGLKRLGFDDPREGVSSPQVAVLLRVSADVKGSPFDPSAEAPVRVLV